MAVLSIPYKNKRYVYNLPSDWDGVPEEDMLYICPRLGTLRGLYAAYVTAKKEGNKKQTTSLDIKLQAERIKLLKRFAKLPKWPWSKRAKAFYSMYADEVADVLKSLNFVFTERNRLLAAPTAFTYKGDKYLGPSHRFKNITGEEFAFADKAYQHFVKTGEVNYLYELVAILYRPQGETEAHNPAHASYCGDMRRPFNKARLEIDAAHLQKVPKGVLHSVLFWYNCWRIKLQADNPTVFNSKQEKQANTSPLGWVGIFRALSKHPLQLQNTAKLPLGEILLELREQLREVRERELALKK